MSTSEHLALLGLGANLGDRQRQLERAVAMLEGCGRVQAVSGWRETEPEGGVDQPRYLNGAARLVTGLAPRPLLDCLAGIERRLGRVRPYPGAPRTLDIDLLLYDEAVIEEPGLVVPHPRLHARRFVLEPLAEIAPQARHPVMDATVAELLSRL